MLACKRCLLSRPKLHAFANWERSRSPICPGHEIIGRVAAVGEGVETWKEGDRVGGGWHGGHDGKFWVALICYHCRMG